MEVSGTGSHLDHFIRQTRVHHVQLSQMADVKANMMLTISALMITFSIGHLSEDENAVERSLGMAPAVAQYSIRRAK